MGFTGDTAIIRIAFNGIVTAGSFYIDDVHITENSDYPEFSYDYAEHANEVNDITNLGVASGASASSFSYDNFGPSSDRSLCVTVNSWTWVHLSAIDEIDMKGKTLTFDYKSELASVYIGFLYNGGANGFVRQIGNTSGMSVSSVSSNDGSTWKHVVIDFDTLKASGGVTEKSSSYHCFRNATDATGTIYLDNMALSNA